MREDILQCIPAVMRPFKANKCGLSFNKFMVLNINYGYLYTV